MADRKLNTGLTTEQVMLAFDRALHDMTDDEVRAEIAAQVAAEALTRAQEDSRVAQLVSELGGTVAGNYTPLTLYNALEARVAALEGGNADA